MDILIKDESIYEHPIVRFNYTTYDIQRDQDIIHPSHDKKDVLVYTPDNGLSQPWTYARVLNTYHVNVYTRSNTKPARMNFLWVRWFERDESRPTGPCARRLDRVRFLPSTEDDALGFIDPAAVIRGCHLVPAFALGRTSNLMGPSLARDLEGDWAAFDVMMFADRDLAARFTGISVGQPELRSKHVSRLVVDDMERAAATTLQDITEDPMGSDTDEEDYEGTGDDEDDCAGEAMEELLDMQHNAAY